MFCSSCGFEYQGNPKFCGKCGVAISQKKRITEDLINKDSFASKVSNQHPKRNIDPNRKKIQKNSGPIRINGFFNTLIIGFSLAIGSATISKYIARPIYYILSSLNGGSDAWVKQLTFMLSQMISGIIILIPLLIIINFVCEFMNWIINSFQEEK